MERCPDQSNWGAYSRENMDGLGSRCRKRFTQG